MVSRSGQSVGHALRPRKTTALRCSGSRPLDCFGKDVEFLKAMALGEP
ncbi:hypothetical protein J2S89_000472 [Arthrobacter bambusae]|nr:hypothetical protein [Arthrobacter bambusae]MDQ0096542.1 hypothetical protein [Arthrobacter bambusae]